jgi:hypothetical protein
MGDDCSRGGLADLELCHVGSTLLLEGSTAITDTTSQCGLLATRRSLEEAQGEAQASRGGNRWNDRAMLAGRA